MAELLSALWDWWVAAAPRRIGPYYPYLNAAHILALALLVGGIAAVDLRLLGAYRRIPLDHLATPLTRLAGTGLVVALITGFLLFSVQPAHYATNTAFRIKLVIVAVGVANVLVVRAQPAWRRALGGAPVATALKACAVVSISAWVGAVLSGRWIAFL